MENLGSETNSESQARYPVLFLRDSSNIVELVDFHPNPSRSTQRSGYQGFQVLISRLLLMSNFIDSPQDSSYILVPTEE